MKLNYTPAGKKGNLHILEINGETFTNTTGKAILKWAETKDLTKHQRKHLSEAIRLQEKYVIVDGSTYEDFEKDLHLFITDHPYFKYFGKVMVQKSNEKTKLRYTIQPSKEGDKIMVIVVEEAYFQD